MKRYKQISANSIGAINSPQLSPSLLGEARRTRSTRILNKLQIFFIHLALPVSEVKIVALIVLAQHEGHERIGKAQKRFRYPSPMRPNITR